MEKRFVRKCDEVGVCPPITELPSNLCSFSPNSQSYGDIIVDNILTAEIPGPVISPMTFDSDSDVENLVSDMASDITVSRLDLMAAHINAIRGRKKTQKSDVEATKKDDSSFTDANASSADASSASVE